MTANTRRTQVQRERTDGLERKLFAHCQTYVKRAKQKSMRSGEGGGEGAEGERDESVSSRLIVAIRRHTIDIHSAVHIADIAHINGTLFLYLPAIETEK